VTKTSVEPVYSGQGIGILEEQDQAALMTVVLQLLTARESLASLRSRLAKAGSAETTAAALRTAIDCQIHDRLDPLVRDLTAAGELSSF
jgi:hypothetical protein